MRVEESIDIARAAEDVWDPVADPVNDLRWCRKVKTVEAVGPRRRKVLHKPVALRPAKELWLDQLELDRPRVLTAREEDDSSVSRVEYRLVPSGSGTRFTQVSEYEWKTPPRLLHRTGT